MFLLQVVEMKLWHDGGGCEFILLGVGPNRLHSNSKSILLLDGQLSLYDIIRHLMISWMVQPMTFKGKGTTNLS